MTDEMIERPSFLRRARSTLVATVYVTVMAGSYAGGHHLFAVIGLAVSTIMRAIESDLSRADTIPILDMDQPGSK
jgi:hypothetical protein